jgi:hypothetical protein
LSSKVSVQNIEKTSHVEVIQREDQSLLVQFQKLINEDTVFPDLSFFQGRRIVFDLERVVVINSVGIRNWINWRKTIGVITVFVNCPKAVIDQMNILNGFVAVNSVIESFYVPYYCEDCDLEKKVLYRSNLEFVRGTSEQKSKLNFIEVTCESCSSRMEMDILEKKYFNFLGPRED